MDILEMLNAESETVEVEETDPVLRFVGIAKKRKGLLRLEPTWLLSVQHKMEEEILEMCRNKKVKAEVSVPPVEPDASGAIDLTAVAARWTLVRALGWRVCEPEHDAIYAKYEKLTAERQEDQRLEANQLGEEMKKISLIVPATTLQQACEEAGLEPGAFTSFLSV